MELEHAFRVQARACAAFGSPMYAELLEALADDIRAGGPTREVLRGHEDDAGPSALALRLMGGTHRLVLAGEAPELAACYPSVDGRYAAEPALRALLALIEARRDYLAASLVNPPQTNEVGRAAALFGALLLMPQRAHKPIRLFEIGASAGLNLRFDRFAYVAGGRVYGHPDSGVRLEPAWSEPLPARQVEVVSREGTDVAPIDVSSEEGALTLASYVWPDQTARLDRLRAAIALARRVPAELGREDAVCFVERIVPKPGTLTVLWHSIMLQYLDAAEQAALTRRIDEIGAAASEEEPFVHVSFERRRRTPQSGHEYLVTGQLWPRGERHVVGSGVAHGLPVAWEHLTWPGASWA